MLRVGQGYDLHKLKKGRDLILCGEKIPFKKGLLGHSDADVATHALIDSLLGAAALKDIGSHFPDSNENFKNINSLILLKKTVLILKNNNFEISNVDLTIVAKEPKLAPFIEKMKENIMPILNIPKTAISIKATTEENLGITKKGSCIACFSCCLIKEIKE